MVRARDDLARERAVQGTSDWCLHVEGRRRSQGRNQLILDYSRQDVRDYIVKTISDILSSAPITYVKWDMNRNMTEIGSALLPADRQRETAHRYMLGLYDVLETITSKFSHILFESRQAAADGLIQVCFTTCRKRGPAIIPMRYPV